MHYLAFVIIPAEGDPTDLVTETLAPFDEQLEVPTVKVGELARLGDAAEAEIEPVEYEGNPRGLWDWWQIGGRWTGWLSGYDPRTDPALTEPCPQCHGDLAEDRGCNGCDSTGRARIWPTSWPRHDGDIVVMSPAEAAALPEGKMPFALFTHGAEHLVLKEVWTEADGSQQCADDASMKKTLTITLSARERAGVGSRVVVVDYHC
uniref:hypothetical protein n=1 Tax=Pseudonocardia sp. CA-138482 TaxID=3240023 RepID=UPI003F49400C